VADDFGVNLHGIMDERDDIRVDLYAILGTPYANDLLSYLKTYGDQFHR
jgi:hypothetical protein